MEKLLKGLHITHNDTDALGCDVLLKCLVDKINFKTYYGEAGKGDECFIKAWNEYFFEKNDAKEFITIEKEPSKHILMLLKCIKFIFITDISLSEELCQKVVKHIKYINNTFHEDEVHIEIFGIDHHITNTCNRVCSNFLVTPTVNLKVFNGDTTEPTPVSAAFLLFDFLKMVSCFYPLLLSSSSKKEKLEYILRFTSAFISEYDTWLWRKDPNKLINYVMKEMENSVYKKEDEMRVDIYTKAISVLGIENTTDMLINHIFEQVSQESDIVNFIPPLFKTIEKVDSLNESRAVDFFINSNKLHIYDETFEEYIYGVFISENQYSNRICEEIYNKYDFIDVVMVIYPSSKQIGLRSKKEDINLGRLSKRRYGGGGHPSAAGAHLSSEGLLSMMETYYYNSPNITEYLFEKEEE